MDYPLHYYDLVLVAIAVSIGVGAGIGLVTGVSLAVAVPLLALVAVVIIGHALFVNGPVSEPADLAKPVEPEEVPVLSMATSRSK